MQIHAFIPCRYGSTRLPGKPLRLIQGKPMIQHVYDRVSQAKHLDGIWIATDDERIREVAEGFGGNVLMTDPVLVSGTDRIGQAADQLGLSDHDLLVNIQGDQPLIDSRSVESVIAPFQQPGYDGTFEMSTLSYAVADAGSLDNAQDCKLVVDQDGFALYFSRSLIPFDRDRKSPTMYLKHLGVYAYTKRFVETFCKLKAGRLESLEKLEQLRALENNLKVKVATSLWDSPEVDVLEDIETIERQLAR